MLFSSLTFIFGFLPLLLLLYFSCKNIKIKNAILLLFSILFYSWGEPRNLVLMIVTIVISYLFGLLINYYDKKKNKLLKKTVFILSIISILGLLIYFKYTNFIISNINNLFGAGIVLKTIVLPIGISFYTFQILSYIVDLYRGKFSYQKNIFLLALYVSIFPQLIAGPIVRYETVMKELSKRKETFDGFCYGIKRFIFGLSKKVLIANQVAIIADNVFDKYNSSYGTSIIWIGVLAYTLQIYYDFSGYSDMAIGLGKIFGFNFLENFNYPYIASSITDFWRRWHISLSSWFRDYIYIPLGGNRVSKIKWIRNILIVWILTGLWHGAAWNFIIWGLYYAIILLLEKNFLNKYIEKLPKCLRWLYSFILIMIGWLIFRVNSLNDLFVLFTRLFTFKPTNWLEIFKSNIYILPGFAFLLVGLIFAFPIIKNLDAKYKNRKYYNAISSFVLITIFVICIIFLVSSNYNPFIYFRF